MINNLGKEKIVLETGWNFLNNVQYVGYAKLIKHKNGKSDIVIRIPFDPKGGEYTLQKLTS